MSLSERNRVTLVFRFSCSKGSPGPDRVRIAIHMTRFNSFAKGGVWTVNGQTFEGGAGDIFVIKAGEIHSFKALGNSPLIQVDVHLSPFHPRELIVAQY